MVNSFTSFGNEGLFASGSQDTLIKIWDSREGVLVQTFDEKNGGKVSLEIKIFLRKTRIHFCHF